MMLTIVIVHLMRGEPAADSLDVATEASVARIIGQVVNALLDE